MSETRTFNEVLLDTLETDMLSIKPETYFTTINKFYPYFVDPVDIDSYKYPIAYAVIGDETENESDASKRMMKNDVDVTIGIIIKVTKENSETKREKVKKSIKKYYRSEAKLNNICGIDAVARSVSGLQIKHYSHLTFDELVLIEFIFKIKTQIIN